MSHVILINSWGTNGEISLFVICGAICVLHILLTQWTFTYKEIRKPTLEE